MGCAAHFNTKEPRRNYAGIIYHQYIETVYAKERGSAAAPTAGLHFTKELLEQVKARGVEGEEGLLPVGLGSFGNW